MTKINHTILFRKSVISFSSEKPVEQELIDEIFNAASLAPSSNNIQPWRYYYAKRGEPEFEVVLSSLAESNIRWAKNASMLIVSLAQMEYERKGTIYKNKYAFHDTGMANIQLMLQATELGFVTHPMGGFDADKIKQELKLTQEYEPVIVIALGYLGNDKQLPADLLERQRKPKERKPIDEIFFRAKH